MRSSGTSSPARQLALPAVAGVAAGVAAAGAGELTAALLVPTGSPFTVIGAAAIDLAPTWAKDAAIALFGTADKIAFNLSKSPAPVPELAATWGSASGDSLANFSHSSTE